MKKLCIDKAGRGKMKKNEKKCDLQFKKTYFFYCSFLAALLALHFKDDL
jgi:hypothetical protein